MTETRMGEPCECGEREERFDPAWRAWACIACGTLVSKRDPEPGEPLPVVEHDVRADRVRIVAHIRARAAVESDKADELDAIWKSKEHTPYVAVSAHHASLCHRHAAACLLAEADAIEVGK